MRPRECQYGDSVRLSPIAVDIEDLSNAAHVNFGIVCRGLLSVLKFCSIKYGVRALPNQTLVDTIVNALSDESGYVGVDQIKLDKR